MATLAGVLGVLAVVDLLLGPLLAYAGLVAPMTGFGIFALGVLGGLLAIVCGAIGLLRTGAGSGRGGRGLAWTGVVAGLVVLGTLLTAALPGRGLPRINDITTDTTDPPRFRAAQQDPPNRGRDFDYPRGFRDPQREAYPDLAPILLVEPASKSFVRAQEVAGDLGWEIVDVRESQGVFEARDTSGLFRFVDDVVVRVRPVPAAPTGSVVDVRSKSRDGQGDLGVNAKRIREFSEALSP